MILKDLSGQRFERLRVLGRAPNNNHNHPCWWCRCDCGKLLSVDGCNLKTGNSKSCGCLQKEIASDSNKILPYEASYRAFVRSAAHHNELLFEDFLEFTKVHECHYCDESVYWTKHYTGLRRGGYNLDRKDNNLGYTKDNVVVCCKRCNYGKSQFFTYDEWVEIGKLIRSWKK